MSRDAFKLDVVSIRLVRDAPIYSDQKLNSPQAAVHLVGEVLCDMDRELVCVINLKADGTPINCSFVSAGTLDYSVVNPRDMLEGKQMGESGFFANSSDAMPALYEKMLKTSVEEPERIKDIGYVLKMVTDKDIIPDEFRELYETFCNTLKIRR